ncbi:unnamed protein product [Euphydryas editha]|uniref:TERF2-interacting telomeric protein 1 Myb domain-containing protein n=1 Tax=Euphydryas editha TaxID=104508 RepID=A0AAU9TZ35_EUPED|nr:unnamed protein product [Euphydryas editha]
MKEMKAIVEYLTEHKAYSEIKGRKMWKELADSKVTNRTWQSLKETFLKRILPDIQNPYYKLSLHQISSFKQGYDVETRLNNKLKIRSDSQDSNTESEDKTNDLPDDNKDKNENPAAGEDLKQSESDLRASTETLVLENVEEKDELPKKSLRELITYSEPLTPMLQAVIDDFASDEGEGSNDEPRMQIVELSETEANNDCEDKDTKDTAVENANPKESQEQNKSTEEIPDTAANKSPSPKKSGTEKSQMNNKEPVNYGTCNGKNGNISIVISDTDEVSQKNKDEINKEKSAMNQPKTSTEMTQNSNTTTDTLLPNNQEGFKEKSPIVSDNSKELVKETQNRKRGKKRANSQENQCSAVIKKRLNKEKQAISDTDTIISSKRNISTKSSQITFKQNIPEATVEPLVIDNRKSNDVVEETLPKKDTKTKNNLDNNEKKSEEIENPCLKSVSLYDEQFSNSKYTDSETSHNDENKNNDKQKKEEKQQPSREVETKVSMGDIVNKQVVRNQTQVSTANTDALNAVVMLKSHSDSHSDSGKERTKKVPERKLKQNRDRVLADVFGFSSGGVRRNRKSNNKYRRRTLSQNQTLNISSDSSEWTSDTGSEYISPPRGRRNRQSRKYLKPKSARILSLEEEGGLFVMYGKKIYPVVKDGKIIKNYVTYTPDDDQEESFWKLKYVEEKKRTAELTKLLNQVQEKNNQDEPNGIPVLPTTSRIQRDENPKKTLELVTDKTPFNKDKEEEKPQEEKTVKIKFTKNNEEVQLEGHWSHVNPVLAQVMQLFQKPPELKSNEVKSIQQPDPRNISREQTPVTVVIDEGQIRLYRKH